MKEKTVELKNLSIGYFISKERKSILPPINATIYSGELTCLLGANGIGKSTLLRTLSAFQPAINGKILIKGKDISDFSVRELSSVIGVVLTDKTELKNMTVTELVGMGRNPHTGFWGKLNGLDKKIISEAIRSVNIDKLAMRMIHTLSDGERQKVMIAKALAQETDIIFLDEPTAFLDFPSKIEIMQLLRRLSKESGKTIFLSTHDLELALQIADKLWLMDKDGVKTEIPDDLFQKDADCSFFQYPGCYFDRISRSFRIN